MQERKDLFFLVNKRIILQICTNVKYFKNTKKKKIYNIKNNKINIKKKNLYLKKKKKKITIL